MPKIEDDERYMDADLEKVSKFFKEIDYGTIFSHLVYLKDKKVFWANEGESLIMSVSYTHLEIKKLKEEIEKLK